MIRIYDLNCSAQNDANFRKEKIQSLKRRGDKQMGADSKQRHHRSADISSFNSQLSEQSTRIDRLLKEIDALKETNKNLTEQVQVMFYNSLLINRLSAS